jgi:hypothetical protein
MVTSINPASFSSSTSRAGDPWPKFSEAAVGLALSDPSQRSLLQARPRGSAFPAENVVPFAAEITRRRSNQEHKNLVGGANPSWRGKKRRQRKRKIRGNSIKFGICSAAICAWGRIMGEGDCLKSLLHFYERNATGPTGNLGLHIVLGNPEV